MTGHWKDHGYDRERFFVRKTDPAVADAVKALFDARDGDMPRTGSVTISSAPLAVLLDYLIGTERDQAKRYFVLRYDCEGGEAADPHAREALAKYAESVQFDNQQFAADLFEELENTKPPED